MLAEARGEGLDGMRAVGFNIRNRADSNFGKYGSSIRDQVLAPKQYSSWNHHGSANQAGRNALKIDPNSPLYKQAETAADDVMGRVSPDITHGATNYRNPAHSSRASDAWANKLVDQQRIGNHVFGRDPNVKIAQDTNPNAIGDKTMMAGLTRDAGTPTSSQTLMASLSPAPAQQAPQTTASMLADATVPTPPQRPHFMRGDAPMPPERPNMPDMQLASQPPMDQAPPVQSDLGMASIQNPTALGGEGFATSALTTPMLGSNMPVSPLPTMFSDAMNPAMGSFDGGMGGVGDFGGPSFDLAGAFG
jgi:spore germination cell wall hydrolase CwlJ-like protein